MISMESRIKALTPAQRNALTRALHNRNLHSDASHQTLHRVPCTGCALSPAQMRLWRMSQIGAAKSTCHIPGVFHLSGTLNRQQLQQALSVILQRHEILRTTFDCNENGQPWQTIHPVQTLDFDVLPMPIPLQLGSEAVGRAVEAAVEEAVEEAVEDQAAIAQAILGVLMQPFDLSCGPLWRARLLPLPPGRNILILSFHHIVFDGWSLGVFARELFSLYQALAQDKPVSPATANPDRRPAMYPYPGPANRPGTTLPAAPAWQYSDYVAWRAQPGREKIRQHDIRYWQSTLAGGLPVLSLPADRPRPALSSCQGAIHKLVLPRTVFDALLALARHEGATAYAAFLGYSRFCCTATPENRIRSSAHRSRADTWPNWNR